MTKKHRDGALTGVTFELVPVLSRSGIVVVGIEVLFYSLLLSC